MTKIKLHADVRALKRAAPSWAKWLCCTEGGIAWWQDERGKGCVWKNPSSSERRAVAEIWADSFSNTAICLTTGSVHLQSDDGKITVVPQSVWVAARKRKGRAR